MASHPTLMLFQIVPAVQNVFFRIAQDPADAGKIHVAWIRQIRHRTFRPLAQRDTRGWGREARAFKRATRARPAVTVRILLALSA
jgi:hypothetical protein